MRRPASSILGTALLLVVFPIITACAPARSSRVRTLPDHVRPSGAVGIVAVESTATGAKACNREKVARCVRRGLVRSRPGLRVLPPEKFWRSVFSGFPITDASTQPEPMTLLLQNARFRARIAPLQLRYLVVVGGSTTTISVGGDSEGWSCGYFGCFGSTEFEQETRMAATVFDVAQPGRWREVTASHDQRGFFAVIFILPLYVPARTVSPACRTVATEILHAMDELESVPDAQVTQAQSESMR